MHLELPPMGHCRERVCDWRYARDVAGLRHAYHRPQPMGRLSGHGAEARAVRTHRAHVVLSGSFVGISGRRQMVSCQKPGPRHRHRRRSQPISYLSFRQFRPARTRLVGAPHTGQKPKQTLSQPRIAGHRDAYQGRLAATIGRSRRVNPTDHHRPDGRGRRARDQHREGLRRAFARQSHSR